MGSEPARYMRRRFGEGGTNPDQQSLHKQQSSPITLPPLQPTYQENRKNTTRDTVTAFIDLLGMSNALGKLDRISDKVLPKEEAAPLIKQSIGAILSMRHEVEEVSKAWTSSDPPEGLTQEEAQTWSSTKHGDKSRWAQGW